VVRSTKVRSGHAGNFLTWLKMPVANTLAYLTAESMTNYKSLITMTPVINVTKHFSLTLTKRPNKLECLSLAILCSLFGIITENFDVTLAPHFLSHCIFLIYFVYSTTAPLCITFNHFGMLPKLCVYKHMCSSE
jgi:hypothetical protein